jgi:hemolysin activation/secretion protein
VHYQAALFDQLKWGDGWALSDHNVSFGVDNKDIKGDILFTLFGDPISTGVGSDVEVINAVLGYEGQLADPFGGETTISTSMVYSPGGLSARNRGDNFLTARSDVDAEYMYARFSAKRSQPTSWNFLGKDMTFLAGAEGQVSADRLIGSERFVNFNRQGFRGYNSGVMSGDSGLANFVELETGSYSLMPTKYWEDSVKASVFADFGVFYDNDPQGEEGREGYLSVGASLNYRINDQIDSELTFSHALSGQGDSDDEQAVMYKMLFGY